ncbi:SRPBCC domain-containing protein [Micromonospora sp. NPDC000089]|uniref:SRPBCC domain-containing protein n=1 Tax=unclassified Micromonospora TaxID=2617518 RepID=UPI003678AAF1
MGYAIVACEPPYRLALTAGDEQGAWHLDLVLTETADGTRLRFTQHLAGLDGVGEIGPGWEYYLDRLLAAREGQPAPDFADYYPSMKEHFEAQR